MKLMEKILGILSICGAFCSALFFLLFKHKDSENKMLEEKYSKASEEIESKEELINAQLISKKAGDESRGKNAKTKNKIHGDNGAESISAIADVLCDR